ncbi:GMC family oxidoreductase N-terminal domain-containing protein [Nocardia terpenica]|uniref:GMC family oxidoreductase n=1 Tax=Nocardia terpenica TaxID=455432 RepID=UPI001893A2B6|nr:GMC family oxidoreductase [Nocardia terpenica]MBF6060826.1 GMC family oxidoreductase N-terminal domain-containing protein [Nocardia terpenica]MBF6104086.1 GMC family oxidoreductase N-terminal domain-containing protein [Nocardia terpenica]MBF6111540.1 GMC family oxidoreductase N-terminal domain-containing protein [Nocardia terpenica]MBF6118307.1 GMC family oxidoreductase N-terminal domain-containing protein [Nocardia terpenica]MBF6156068.1 GMC family oxidoreductase N-terminal domain-containi
MEPTERQRAALTLICETFAPGDGPELPAAGDLGAVDTVVELLARNPRAADAKRLALLLDVWDSPLLGLVTGVKPRRFSALSQGDRERILLRLGNSPIAPVRAVFQALKQAALLAYSVTPGPSGANPLWRQLGYPAPPGTLPTAPAPPLTPVRPGETALSCDVVVVGSGAGGGVAAAVLAEAGLDVLVLERGNYYDDRDFGGGELDALRTLYAPGPPATAEGQLTLVAGGCLGGGTVVNWSTALPTPDDVRAEWASLGVPQFDDTEYDDALAAVQKRLSVTDRRSPPSARDAVLERGARALGWQVDTLTRNVSDVCDAGIECGRCGYGCRLGAKQSVTKTWLADAAAHGARVMVGADVRAISVRNWKADGVSIRTAEGAEVQVQARAVVVAAGAVQTPALLRRSGLRNPAIGRYLRLHPAAAVFGVFDEEIRPWEGGLQTRICRRHSDLDGDGYGVVYETGPVHPGLATGFLGWGGADDHLRVLRDLPHSAAIGVITRDRDSGVVTVDRSGEPVVKYRLSPYDRDHLHIGIIGAAAILEAAGARRIFSGHQAGISYDPGRRGSHAEFAAACRATGYAPGRCAMGALHIMGSARMGDSPRTSATNPDGATWEIPNIVVADASCFPTASGVNPMVSIEAIAHMNAKRLAARLNRAS